MYINDEDEDIVEIDPAIRALHDAIEEVECPGHSFPQPCMQTQATIWQPPIPWLASASMALIDCVVVSVCRVTHLHVHDEHTYTHYTYMHTNTYIRNKHG